MVGAMVGAMVGTMVVVDSWSESAAVYLKEYDKLYVARKGTSHVLRS